MQRSRGQPAGDERPPDQRVRARDRGVHGGGRQGAVRGRDLHRRPHEQDDGKDR